MDWREFLTALRPREDLYEDFPPEMRTDYQPALLNEGSLLAAARVAARLLFIVAKRGGSRVSPAALEKLIGILDEALPDTAPPHCDDEAARVLDWIETAETAPPEERDQSSLPPELDLMLAADIESRISVAQFAIDEDYDLELEYYEEANSTWPRFRCRPLDIETDEDDDSQLDPMLRVERDGREIQLPIKTIRWLMPVQKTPDQGRGPSAREQLGDVLDFPTERLTGPPEEEAPPRDSDEE